jgi:hypothetical protein
MGLAPIWMDSTAAPEPAKIFINYSVFSSSRNIHSALKSLGEEHF